MKRISRHATHPRVIRAAWLTAAVFALGITAPAVHAATDVWNNTGTAWETGPDWTPAGPPTATDIASFDPTVMAASVMNPTINSTTDVASALNLDNNFLGGTYTFTGAGTLTLGGAVTVRGYGTQTFNGPALAGTGASTLTFNVGTSTGLTLTGTTTATTTGTLNLNGGTFTLDNSTGTTAHIAGAAPVSEVGGTLSVVGNSAGTSYSLGAASFNGGFNTVSVNAANGATSINFANTGSFSLRTQTFMVEQFVSTSGALGTAAGGVISFTGTPYAGANGLVANSANGGTVGFATVRDTNGVNFAVYTAPSGGTGGIQAATPTQTTISGSALQTYAATDRVQYNNAGTADTATATVTNGSLRITATSAGGSLALGTNALATNALMLDGANNFTISGTGALGGTGTRYIYVNNAATTLTTSIQIANGSNPTDIAGPGFLVLNGTASQNTLTTTNRLTLLGGVLRGNNTQLGFGAAGGAGFLNFRGGVLEITGGSNGAGASADFTRPLATTVTAGATNWTSGATDQGSGGFSAYGSNASVNLGGAATPTGVTWGTGGFVADGYALRFGSTQSNAVLTFQNPVGLDAGTTGTYAAREISVTAGTGGDGTVLSGVVSGSGSSDLIKTGTGTLTLSASNTYVGRTFVQGGTLLVNGANSGTGAVVVNNSGSTLGGTGTITGAVTVNSGARIAPGTTAGTTAVLNTGALTLQPNSIHAVDITGAAAAGATAAAGSTYDQINVTGTVTVGGALALNISGYTPTSSTNDEYFIVNNDGTDAVVGTYSSVTGLPSGYSVDYNADFATGALTGGNDIAIVVAAVPEPATVLGGVLMVGALGWTLRRRGVRGLPPPC